MTNSVSQATSITRYDLIREIKALYQSDVRWINARILSADTRRLISRLKKGTNLPQPMLEYRTYDFPGTINHEEYYSIMKDYRFGYCSTNKLFHHPIDDWVSTTKPSRVIDSLLYKALSNLLIRKYLQNIKQIPSGIQFYNELIDDVSQFWDERSNIHEIYFVDFSPSIQSVSTERLWSSFHYLHNLDVISDLLTDFINKPIYAVKSNQQIQDDNCIPLVGELSDVLLHLFWNQEFDVHLMEEYPGVMYTRWGPELIIASSLSDKNVINSERIKGLLNQTNIEGSIYIIDRGGYHTSILDDIFDFHLNHDGVVYCKHATRGIYY